MEKQEKTLEQLKKAWSKGGNKTKKKYGKDHFKKIGKLGAEKRWGK